MLKLSHSQPQVLDESVAGLRVYVLKDLPACGFSRSNLALSSNLCYDYLCGSIAKFSIQ